MEDASGAAAASAARAQEAASARAHTEAAGGHCTGGGALAFANAAQHGVKRAACRDAHATGTAQMQACALRAGTFVAPALRGGARRLAE
jgi:hypothetical protein